MIFNDECYMTFASVRCSDLRSTVLRVSTALAVIASNHIILMSTYFSQLPSVLCHAVNNIPIVRSLTHSYTYSARH